MAEITVTICNPLTGQSESLPVAPTLTVAELLEWSKALLGMDGDVRLVKDGQPLIASMTLSAAGVLNGDLVAVMTQRTAAPAPRSVPAPAAGSGLNFSNLLASAPAPAVNHSVNPVYFAGMTLADAVESNPHPNAIVGLIQQNPNLFKELNYHNPMLAQKLLNQPFDRAVQIWREDMVKGGIQSAFAQSQAYHKEQDFTRLLSQNPNDPQATEYFAKKERQKNVNLQYQQAMQEYPESMGRVLMLYIGAKINNHTLQAFVDSGAQTTIMSKKCAQKCGIFDLVDTRFAGIAVGVGTGTILGRIHMAQLQIGHVYFPCSVTVMDDMALPSAGGGSADKDGKPATPKDMDFLLGLDMLKRHTCCIDLEQGNLKFRLAPGQYLETPFLHEKDLDESKGGTKGFNADKANQELEDAQRKYDQAGGGGDEDGDMSTS
jgi:DNA damage-inducible protein 1